MKLTHLLSAMIVCCGLAAGAFAAEKKYKDGGCCDKAAKKGEKCKHPCCVEAEEKGEVCKKCNG